MPTPRPIMAARVGAKVATLKKLAVISTSACPRARDSRAVPTGSSAPIREPNANSRMNRAIVTPMPSELGGSAAAASSACPPAPTVRPSTPFAAWVASSTAETSASGISPTGAPNVTVA